MTDKTEARDVPLLTDVNALWLFQPDLPDDVSEHLQAIANGDAAVYNTHTHRVVPIEVEDSVVWESCEFIGLPPDDNGDWFTWACSLVYRNVVVMNRPDHAALLEENARLLKALSFYADSRRYMGSNRPPIEGDEFTDVDAAYLNDVGRDHGQIAQAAIARRKA